MKVHLELLGWMYIVLGGLGIFGAVVVLAVLIGPGLVSRNQEALVILSIVGAIASGFLILISIPSIIAGIGLLKYKPWARALTIILGILNLFNIPIGTVIGVYTFWVLTKEESVNVLSAAA